MSEQQYCKGCDKWLPATLEYWYCQNGKHRKLCRKCESARINEYQKAIRRQGGPKYLTPRKCIICGELFTPRNKHANRRSHCYKPDCIEKNHRQYDAHRVANSREYYAKIRQKRKNKYRQCSRCQKFLIPSHYRGEYCPSCRDILCSQHDMTGNAIFFMPMMEGRT